MIKIPTLVDNETFADLFNMVAEKAQDGMTFVEIGSFLGGSICYMGQKLKELNKNINLIAIDDWKFSNIASGHMKLVNGNDYYLEFLNNVNKCNLDIKSIQSNSIVASQLFSDESIDFLFLDGDHDFPYVQNELIAWLPKMKQNSIISGHDYCSAEGVRIAVKNIFGDNVKFVRFNQSYYSILGKGL